MKTSGFSQCGGEEGRPVWARVVRHAVNRENDPARPPVWTEYLRKEEKMALFAEEAAREWTEDVAQSAVLRWEAAAALARALGDGAHAVVVSREGLRNAGSRARSQRRLNADGGGHRPPLQQAEEEARKIARYQERLAKEHLD